MHIHCSLRFTRPARLPSVSTGPKHRAPGRVASDRPRHALRGRDGCAARPAVLVPRCHRRGRRRPARSGPQSSLAASNISMSPPSSSPGVCRRRRDFEFMQYVHSKMCGDRIKETHFCTNAKKNSQKSTENRGNETSKCDLHVSKRIDFRAILRNT